MLQFLFWGLPNGQFKVWVAATAAMRLLVDTQASSSTAPEGTASCDLRMIFTARFTPARTTSVISTAHSCKSWVVRAAKFPPSTKSPPVQGHRISVTAALSKTAAG